MNILLALKLSSNSLMVAEATALRKASGVDNLALLTDTEYGTEIDGVSYYYLNKWAGKIPIFRVFVRIPVMISICRKEKIDFLIGYHLTSYGFAGFIVSKLLRVPLSVHFLGKDLDELCNMPILGNILLKYAKKIQNVTVQGTNSRKYLERNGLNRIHIIPTACDLSKFRPSIVKKEFDVIFMGRLSKEKRIDRFLDIVNIINKKNIPIRALIVGDGPEKARMLELISNYSIPDSIDYVGWTESVIEYLDQAKIFVLTSDNDQLPSSLIESMSMGLVPVASDVGNVSDVVNDENGVILNKNDVDSFADSIVSLLNDEQMYRTKSLNARKTAKNFSLEANSQRWTSILKDVWVK